MVRAGTRLAGIPEGEEAWFGPGIFPAVIYCAVFQVNLSTDYIVFRQVSFQNQTRELIVDAERLRSGGMKNYRLQERTIYSFQLDSEGIFQFILPKGSGIYIEFFTERNLSFVQVIPALIIKGRHGYYGCKFRITGAAYLSRVLGMI